MEKKEVDRVVLGSLLGHLIFIFATDILYIKTRKASYSRVSRDMFFLKAFFAFLALHTFKEWKYDPLSILGRRFFNE